MELAEVAFSQKVSCRPHMRTPANAGNHASGRDSNEKGPSSLSRWFCVRSCGQSAMLRASNANVSEAQMAVKTFSARGTIFGGNSLKGRVTSQVSGPYNSGCHE